jgi:hypothetical protein
MECLVIPLSTYSKRLKTQSTDSFAVKSTFVFIRLVKIRNRNKWNYLYVKLKAGVFLEAKDASQLIHVAEFI